MNPSHRRHIAIVTEFYPPASGATSQLIYDLAQALPSDILDITVLSPYQSSTYGSVTVTKATLPLPYKLYSILPSKSLKGLYFCCSCLIFLLFSPQYSKLLIVSNPPFAGIVGLILKLVRNTPYLFLFQDVFPKTAVLAGILPARGPLYTSWAYLIGLICSYSQAVLVLSPGMARELKVQYPFLQNIKTLHNWAVEYSSHRNDMCNPYSTKWNTVDRLTLQYSGNFGKLHGMLTILEAARSTQHLPVNFLFVGDGPKKEQILAYIDSFGLTNAKLYPYVPRDDLKYSLGACTLGVISLIPGSQDLVSPSKLLGILASAKPVLLIADKNCALSRVINDYNLGFVIEPGDVTAFVELVAALIADPSQLTQIGLNSLRFYDQHCSKQSAVQLYSKYLADI